MPRQQRFAPFAVWAGWHTPPVMHAEETCAAVGHSVTLWLAAPQSSRMATLATPGASSGIQVSCAQPRMSFSTSHARAAVVASARALGTRLLSAKVTVGGAGAAGTRPASEQRTSLKLDSGASMIVRILLASGSRWTASPG